MCKRLIALTAVVLMLGSVSVSNAADILWTGAGADNLWNNPANWEGNKAPGPLDWAHIESPGATAPNGPLIQDGMHLEIDGMSNELPGEPTLTITGGTLILTGWGIWWGDAGDCVATCNMSGGTVELIGGPGIHEFGWGGASGKWIMTGGTVNAQGVVLSTGPGNTGELYLYGGTYNIGTARAERSDRFGGGLLVNDGGLIDITEGALVLDVLEGEEDRYMQYLEDLMAAGQITAYGGAGEFQMDFDVRNPGKITLTTVEAGKAFKPDPADGTVYEDTWASLSWSPADAAVSHSLYFGEDLEEVTNGTGDTFRGEQPDTFYIVGFPGYPYPDGLVPGTTYYWRVDEVEADGAKKKGDVWSFTVPPKTAFDPSPADGAEFVDQNVELSWTPGFGAMLHTVYFGDSYDDVSNASGGTSQGAATYTPGPLDPEKVYYWRVDEFDATDTHKGDVWAFSTPGAVGNPDPANGAVGVQMNATLSWTPGESATASEVYFGTDKDAVRNATAASPEYKGSRALGSESYDPGKLAWKSTYYWRVDGVGAAGSVKGIVWSFETADFITVDDFESYNEIWPEQDEESSNLVFMTWADGWQFPENGSAIGALEAFEPTMETSIVHEGSQSAPLHYDNTAVAYSEVTAYVANQQPDWPPNTLAIGPDWTEEGVGVLSLWFRGDASNAPEPMYVILNGSATVYHDDPAAAQINTWTEWKIDLQEFADQGVDLTNVNSISIGLGDKNSAQGGGSGKIFLDHIALYRPPPPPVGHWKLDDGQGATAVDSSASGNDGTINNADTGGLGDGGSVWVDDPERGTVISFNGTAAGAFVRAGSIPQMTLTNDFTWAFWAKQDADNTTPNDIIFGNRMDENAVDFVPRQFIKFTPTKFEWHMNGNGDDNLEYDDIPADVWLHHAVVKTADRLTYYRNGIEASSGTFTQALDFPQPLYFGGDNEGSEGENWAGLMSDVRIYDRALSAAEVLGLASQ
ncbi:MAG: LamG domain-containing protein [Planctomycetota bacterium]|jgi:hypothetical protein